MSLLIKNGNVFLDKFKKTNILIEDSKISKIGNNLDKADKIIDATNKHIIPGLIDMHVHFRDFGQEHKEDWISGSKAALTGGITTVFDMPNNTESINSIKRLEEKKKVVSKKTLVNFGLYISVNNSNIDEINDSDVKFVKMYYGQTTGNNVVNDAEEIFKRLKKDILIVVHAEDNDIINMNKDLVDKDSQKYHSLIRNNKAEYIAVHDILRYAEKYGNKVHITHVSCKESLEFIKAAKAKKVKVTCDTCPHYLFLDDSYYEKLGNRIKVNPALKSKEDSKALWIALNEGLINCLCSDHAPHTIEEKELPYEKAPSGITGVGTTLPLMLNAVDQGKIRFEKLIELMTTNPIRLFGIKNKGKIKEGYDADIVILDLDREDVIKAENLHSKSGWSPYEGFKVKGKVIKTIINGKHENQKGTEVMIK